jgi:ABC-type transport system substrate-binding protein
MKNRVLVIVSAVLVCLCFIVGYSFAASSPDKKQPVQKKGAKVSVPKQVVGTAPAGPTQGAVRGGILRAVRSTFPKVLGYQPEQSPTDVMFALPYGERISEWDAKGNLIPVLVESWDADPVNMTITYHLRKGIKFHDGTPWNAEACRWNLQLGKDTGRLTDGQFVKSIEVIDEYTVRITCTEYTSVSLLNYGWLQHYSPTAFNTHGKEYLRTHAFGTGAFKLVDYQRDTLIKYERNPNHWRKGLPLLDGIEVKYIPNAMTAAMMMENNEADIWLDLSEVKYIVDLERKGFKVVWGPGMVYTLLPANAKDPKSPYANKKVREAIEYALDRPTIAKTIGYGKFEPLTQIVPSFSPAHNTNYNPRPYNPEKAKQLLAEAGYPSGFETKLMALEISRDQAIAIQSYLAAVGIKVNIDLADMGRYYSSLYSPAGWTDLILTASGINPDGTDLFTHFGPRPMTYRFGMFIKSPEFVAACEKALKTYEPVALKAALQLAVKQAGDDAMVFPLWRSAQANVMRDYVHSDYVKVHSIIWYSYNDWMDKKK